MKMFYHAPADPVTGELAARPDALYSAARTPDDPSLALVIVEHWNDDRAQDEWEALPGVVHYPFWTWGDQVSARFHSAHASHGVRGNHRIGDAFRAIRAHWGAARL